MSIMYVQMIIGFVLEISTELAQTTVELESYNGRKQKSKMSLSSTSQYFGIHVLCSKVFDGKPEGLLLHLVTIDRCLLLLLLFLSSLLLLLLLLILSRMADKVRVRDRGTPVSQG